MSVGRKTANQKVNEKLLLLNAYRKGQKEGAIEELELFSKFWIDLGNYNLDEMYKIECKLKKYLEERSKFLRGRETK